MVSCWDEIEFAALEINFKGHEMAGKDQVSDVLAHCNLRIDPAWDITGPCRHRPDPHVTCRRLSVCRIIGTAFRLARQIRCVLHPAFPVDEQVSAVRHGDVVLVAAYHGSAGGR